MIYLLDLNFTLVANSFAKRSPFMAQIENEEYRADLIERLRSERVFLITARPVKYLVPTMHRIESQTGWHPERVFFNTDGLPPPSAKRLALESFIIPEYPGESFFAIESNPATRRMYDSFGIQSVTYEEFTVSA